MVEDMTRMKGQSAIEYLTTYGWMLLVIAIVGGAIFTTVQSSSGIQQTTGFTGDDVDISNFGINSGDNLSLEIRAASSDQVIVKNISLTGIGQDQATGVTAYNDTIGAGSGGTIPAGTTKQFLVTETDRSETSNQFDVEITYSTGQLDDLTVQGTLTGNMVLDPE